MEVLTNQLTVEFVAQASDFLQQVLLVMKRELLAIRRDIILTFADINSPVIDASHTTFLHNALALHLEKFYSGIHEVLMLWIHDAVTLGAEMVTNILPPLNEYILPSIDDVFDFDEFEILIFDRIRLFLDNIKTDYMQRVYQSILQQTPTEFALFDILRLFPETDKQVVGMYTWRFKSIIVTEVGRAISEGTQAYLDIASSSFSSLRKQWCCTSRGGRSGHQAIDGTIVELSSVFHVAPFVGNATEPMRFPRDASASALNTVNCGCIMVPILIGV